MNTLSRLILGTAFSLALAACAAGPRAGSASLYDRLGGQPAITAVVDDFVANVAADKRINGQFANTNIPRLKMLLVEQICAGTGAPCQYTCRDMKSAHAHLKIGEADFAALVEDLSRTLDKFKVPAKEQGELIAILAPMKGDIVTVK
mgnify:FL=1